MVPRLFWYKFQLPGSRLAPLGEHLAVLTRSGSIPEHPPIFLPLPAVEQTFPCREVVRVRLPTAALLGSAPYTGAGKSNGQATVRGEPPLFDDDR